MNYTSIIRIFCLIALVLAVACTFCGLVALIAGEAANARAFLINGIAAGIFTGCVILLTDKPQRRARPADGLALTVLFWSLLPAIFAPSFMGGADGQSLLEGFHESVSCLTTSGQSVIYAFGETIPVSVLYWRALLHIAGTIATITAAASVFAALNIDGPGIHRTGLFVLPDGSFFDAMPRLVRAVSVYTGFAVLVVAMLGLFGGGTIASALIDSVSAVSTGLVDPNLAFQDVKRPMRSVSVSLGLIFGTLGLYVWMLAASRRPWRALSDPETLVFVLSIFAIGALAMVSGLDILNALGWALSRLSTSGIALVSSENTQILSPTLVLLPALIGGSALSAAGGIKLARLFVLTKRVGQEFIQLGYRRSVLTFTFRGRDQSERTILGVWVYLAGYIIATAVGVTLFSFGGLPFQDAVRNTVGSLTNSGALIAPTLIYESASNQILVMLGMVLGRLEVLALIPVLTPSFWRG